MKQQKIITIFILCMCILGLTITQSININEASISTKILKLWQAQSPSILNVRQQAAFVEKNNLPTYGIHFEVPEK